MNYRSFLSEAAKSQNMIMAKNLNEDQKTDLIQEINSKLQNLSVKLLKEILSSLKTQEEKKFNGGIDVASSVGCPISDDYVFDNSRGLKARLVHIDPNNKKRVEKLLLDYTISYKNYYKAEFVHSTKKCDVYRLFNSPRNPDSYDTVFLYRE